jgi:outer membrane protein OmpA-like peptidoglycan-associated protein
MRRAGSLPVGIVVGLALGAALSLALAQPARGQDAPAPTSSPPAKVPLDVVIDRAKVDLAAHHLELKASRDLAKVTIKVVGDSGAVLADDSRDLDHHPAGTPLAVSWTPSSDEAVARIEVFAYDVDGYYKGLALTPWSVAIPHEEVNFKTDSADIADPEKPKLEQSFAKVSLALAKHPEIQGVRLFIAGHTDTVGTAEHNLQLSRARAQAIAGWFRQRGLKIAIGWEGFGKSALLIKTADNVDEPRNRRVDYILSVDEPVFKSSGQKPSWHGVR